MNADKPLFVTDRGLHPHETTPRGQGDILVNKLEGRPYGMTKWGWQQLIEHPEQVKQLIELLAIEPEQVKAELARLVTKLNARPKFGDWLLEGRGLRVIEGEQQGPDVPEGFDPNSLKPIGFMRKGDCDYIIGTEMQRRAVEELNAPYGRQLLWWLLNHQELIPEEWKQISAIVFAGDYDLQDPDGCRCVLSLYWLGKWWYWYGYWLGSDRWDAGGRVLTPGNSPS